jgi:hypothetical protein
MLRNSMIVIVLFGNRLTSLPVFLARPHFEYGAVGRDPYEGPNTNS